ncbi:hypothetical protein BKE30_15505 [Alkanindiges hydrocarboniclasticus]|uniref:DUF2971 domain-containing protein n=1 Tax=Alkanindiges hydrocarboniclasticus TaxID=1907941 RepID=A0A1S8CQ09_9GAMM|nr:DUF2971 domain-containing protein [Alkanindiges hydrocarboniclasticus]ONG37020.1 hypothetical protein BKE30_15505 [Alkanindiges hydrocarboniclasticus]
MKVYKYRGGSTYYCEIDQEHKRILERDLESLKADYFWAPTRYTLNDPFECLFKDKVSPVFNGLKQLFPSENTHQLQMALESLLNFIDKSGIYSLSQTPLSELLWSHYAYSHTGFCVEYDLKILTKYRHQNLTELSIQYNQQSPSIELQDILANSNDLISQKMFGYKSQAWSYEEEIRIITPEYGRIDYDYRAVNAIYFGLRMDAQDKNLIMESLKGRSIKYYQMILKHESYQLAYEPIEDLFLDAPPYKYNIAPIADDAIDTYNKEFSEYQNYLVKAAEIVRRDPYCRRVDTVMFSNNKSTVPNPIVIVQYEITPPYTYNHYLTLDEIDEQYSKILDL